MDATLRGRYKIIENLANIRLLKLVDNILKSSTVTLQRPLTEFFASFPMSDTLTIHQFSRQSQSFGSGRA